MIDRENDPLDEVIGAFRRMPVPDVPDAALLFRPPDRVRATAEPAGALLSRTLWRFITRPAVRYGVAAAIVIVAFGWLALGPSSSLALADVIRAAGQHKLVRYHLQSISAARAGQPRAEMKGTVYGDLVRPRSRFEAEPEPIGDGESLLHVSVHDRGTREILGDTNPCLG